MADLPDETPIEQNPEAGIEADATDNLPEEQGEELNGTESGNMVHLDPSAYPEAKDGDTVSTTVEGELMIHNGQKFLNITSAEGKPVMPFGEETASPEGEPSDDELESAMGDIASKMGGLNGYMAK